VIATREDIQFFTEVLDSVVTERIFELPSEYNEKIRYLPKELSQKHGYIDYNYIPFFREILDNFSPLSPIREVALMKSVQIGATTSILEAVLAYFIGSCPRPQLYVSADKELVKKSIEEKVERMLDNSNLRHLIKDQSGTATKKTGDRALEKSYPGGFMHGVGAQSGGKLRSMSYPVLELDEVDGMPDTITKEGDPIALARNRTLVPL
jgi:phage terminase large subunit GpA-like protein